MIDAASGLTNSTLVLVLIIVLGVLAKYRLTRGRSPKRWRDLPELPVSDPTQLRAAEERLVRSQEATRRDLETRALEDPRYATMVSTAITKDISELETKRQRMLDEGRPSQEVAAISVELAHLQDKLAIFTRLAESPHA